MSRASLVLAALLLLADSSFAQSERKPEYLKAEPAAGSLPYRKVVYVDDGTCPRGQIKEVTGGSQAKAIPRRVRCIRRPG
jgi:hypothetical protein